jgi:hypothetical protein
MVMGSFDISGFIIVVGIRAELFGMHFNGCFISDGGDLNNVYVVGHESWLCNKRSFMCKKIITKLFV